MFPVTLVNEQASDEASWPPTRPPLTPLPFEGAGGVAVAGSGADVALLVDEDG